MSFHLGKPVLVMLLLAAISGAVLVCQHGSSPRADLELWVFADSHARTYRGDLDKPPWPPTLVEQYQNLTGKTVAVKLLSARAEDVRLGGLFMGDAQGGIVPDAVEIEIGQVGKFFGPPLQDVGFLPLNDYLRKSGWMEKILKARLAPWTRDGVIFGIPHDVHPVTLTYRQDLFAQAGVDMEQPRTWGEFQAACLKFQEYWKNHGHPDRHALQLSILASDYLTIMLLQRHINVIASDGRIRIAEPKVAQTLAFYAQLVTGMGKIAVQSSGEGASAMDMNNGNICAFITPDWRIHYLKEDTAHDPVTGRPILEGKMRMRPLPIFEDGDAPTSTWGGTMIGIPRACRQPDEAWKLIEFLYLSPEGIRARRQYTDILPPVTGMWNDAEYQQADPYFGGQFVGRLFVEMAGKIPERCVRPATSIAGAILSLVLNRARSYIELRGSEGLERQCQAWLEEGAADLQRRIEHSTIIVDDSALTALGWQGGIP